MLAVWSGVYCEVVCSVYCEVVCSVYCGVQFQDNGKHVKSILSN